MIFRLSQKLAKKIGASLRECLPTDENPYLDWCAHVFTAGRIQYIILTNTRWLYTIVVPGRGITNGIRFVQTSLQSMSQFMAQDGLQALYERWIAPGIDEILFSKNSDRRVLGSMNDLVFYSKLYLVEHGMSPSEVSRDLNTMPMSLIEYEGPREAFQTGGSGPIPYSPRD